MENIQSIKSRIKTINNIQKAANAIKVISSIKLSSINRIDVNSLQSSVEILRNTLSIVAAEALYFNELNESHWIKRKQGRKLLIVLSVDQGFCGAFKQSLIESAENFILNNRDCFIEIFGKKLSTISSNVVDDNSIDRNIKSRYSIEVFANKLKEIIFKYVVEHNVHEVYVVSGEYKSAMVQTTKCFRILPLTIKDFKTFSTTEINTNRVQLLDYLLNRYLYTLCFDIIREHLLAELSVRVFAVDKTSRNADDMQKELTLLYNRTRQTKITQELTEIVSSSECVR